MTTSTKQSSATNANKPPKSAAKSSTKTSAARRVDALLAPAKRAKKRTGKSSTADTAKAPAVDMQVAEDAKASTPCPDTATPLKGKIGQVVALLERDGGASLTDLMAATGWQAHSVRGALSTLKKKLGRPLQSTTEADGQRVYRLARA